MYDVSRVTCHLSPVTCHLSHVPSNILIDIFFWIHFFCYILYIFFFIFFFKGWVQLLESLLSTGHTPSFCLKYQKHSLKLFWGYPKIGSIVLVLNHSVIFFLYDIYLFFWLFGVFHVWKPVFFVFCKEKLSYIYFKEEYKAVM